MLEVKVDLIPFGQEKHRRTIASMTIINDGTGTHDVGNYKYTLKDRSKIRRGTLKKHHRRESVFQLIKKILYKAV